MPDLVPTQPRQFIESSQPRRLEIYFSGQFLRFVLFGGTAAVVNLACGLGLYDGEVAPIPYWSAVTLAALAGLIVNFCLNYYFNFSYRGRSALGQLSTFCVIAGVGTVLTATLAVGFRAIVILLADSVPVPGIGNVSAEFVAHFFAVGAVTFYSFAAHRYFTFNVGLRRRLVEYFAARRK